MFLCSDEIIESLEPLPHADLLNNATLAYLGTCIYLKVSTRYSHPADSALQIYSSSGRLEQYSITIIHLPLNSKQNQDPGITERWGKVWLTVVVPRSYCVWSPLWPGLRLASFLGQALDG